MRARIAGICLLAQLMFAFGARGQTVRTIFFVRHADKISDETDAPLSEAARDGCPKEDTEYGAALVELKRLGAPAAPTK
jgi:hypothetical protein